MRASLSTVCVALIIAGCAADDPASTQPPTTDVSVTTASTAGEAMSVVEERDPTITIEGFSFGTPLEIPLGSGITVVNRDASVHTWTSDDGVFDSGNLSTDQEFTHVFDTQGEFGFFCVIHPGMTGTITVTG